MGSTYTSLHFHIIFSTKERRPLIATPWRPRLHEYLGGTVRGLGGVAETVGGVDDHVHILASLSATHRLADFLRELKKASSVWSAENHERSFAWQVGYAAFSVSPTHREAVRRYIENQEEHHRKVGFIDELKRLLERNGVEYDPKYLL
ncbi:MAG: IS200/IS605 family transposase [Thermoguttaceae bacterium]|jgi:REP element-mobilizing transposase RayT